MPHFQVQHRPGVVDTWDGELAAHTTTRIGDRPRWVEISVYQLEDGGWLSHRAGMSVVYHSMDTACRRVNNKKRGVPATIDDLPDDAEPCEDCNPPLPLDLGDDEQVRFETANHTIDRGSPAQITRALTTSRDRTTGRRLVKASEPVLDVLTQLATKYPEWANIDQGEDNDEGHDLPGGGPGRRAQDDQEPASRRA